MFTAITLCPKSVGAFVADHVSRAAKEQEIGIGYESTQEASDYAIELVTDLQSAIDHVCETGKIDNLSDDESVEFKVQSNGIAWTGSLWVTVYDDLPGCPVEVNCSIAHYSESNTHETLIGTMPDERYESFDVITVSGYSRSDVREIKRESQDKEVSAYVKGYASGQESMNLNFDLTPKKGNLLR